MRLRAKFQVRAINRTGYNRVLVLSAVSGEENKPWSKYTPSGSMEMTVDNAEAWPAIDALNIGDLYYVDLTPANAPAPAAMGG